MGTQALVRFYPDYTDEQSIHVQFDATPQSVRVALAAMIETLGVEQTKQALTGDGPYWEFLNPVITADEPSVFGLPVAGIGVRTDPAKVVLDGTGGKTLAEMPERAYPLPSDVDYTFRVDAAGKIAHIRHV